MEIEKSGNDINSKSVTNSKFVTDKERESEAGNVLNQEKPNPLFPQSCSENKCQGDLSLSQLSVIDKEIRKFDTTGTKEAGHTSTTSSEGEREKPHKFPPSPWTAHSLVQKWNPPDHRRAADTKTDMDSDFIDRLQNICLTEEEGEILEVRATQREKFLEECSLTLLGRFLTTRPYNLRAAKAMLRTAWKLGNDVKIIDVGERVRKGHNGEVHNILEIPLDKPIRRGGRVASPEGERVRVGFKYERLVGLCYQCGIFGHELKECPTQSAQQQTENPYGEWLRARYRKTGDTSDQR
nr:hypothetical protein CFP56_35324 [Quercus suber]